MAAKKKKISKPFLQRADLAKKYWRQIAAVAVVLVLLVGVGVWYTKVYASATNVFNAMISDNLALSGVSRELNQPVCLSTTGSAGNIIQLTYSPTLEAHCITRITDNSTKPASTVLAETIGVAGSDYERYALIQKPGNSQDRYTNVYKMWLKDGVDTSSQQLLVKSLFNPVLFGDVAAPKRAAIVAQLKQAYNIDYKRIEKSHFSGRLTYGYNVNINLEKFSKAWNLYAAYYGLGKNYLIKPGTYTTNNRLAVNIQVDALSRQVKSVNFQGVSEVYGAYGVSNPAAIPTKTYSPDQLQKALNQIK